jgi:isoquinoline 1-oxidoreductase alpha subunit
VAHRGRSTQAHCTSGAAGDFLFHGHGVEKGKKSVKTGKPEAGPPQTLPDIVRRLKPSGEPFPAFPSRRRPTATSDPENPPMSTLNVNGRNHTVDADPGTPILWALRDTLGLTGTKFGCGAALCGACTVHLDGAAIRSCVTPISAAEGKRLTTVEAVTGGADRVGAAVHAAWVKHDVAQCGYCQSGQIMSATAFLKSLPRGKQPSAAEIDSAMAGNICRCGTYARIRTAVADAAKNLA